MFEAPTPDPAALAAFERVKRGGGLPRGYVAGWVIAGCLALAYTGEVALGTVNLPALLAGHGGGPPAAPVENVAVLEAKRLREALAEFQHDIGKARRDLEARAIDPGVVASLTAVEERMSITTGIAPALPYIEPVATAAAPTPLAPPVAAVVPAAAPAPISVPVPMAVSVAVAVPPATAPAAVTPVSNDAGRFSIALPPLGGDAQPLETGSIARPGKLTGQLPKGNASGATLGGQAAALAQTASPAAAEPATSEPIAFGPAVVKAAPKPFGVQLGSGPSLDAIRLNWSLLAEQHGDALGRLQPHFTATGTPAIGQTFDLVAGPIKSVGDAKKVCKVLAARGTDCKVTSSLGETF